MRSAASPPLVFLFGVVITAAALFAPGLAVAQSWFTIDSCDSVHVGNATYIRLSFTLTNRDSQNYLAAVTMKPVPHTEPGDTCHVIEIGAPPGWYSDIRLDGGPIWLSESSEVNPYIVPGESLVGFSVTLSRTTCCYIAGFFGALIDEFANTGVCFACPIPTASRAATWGRVKVLYR